MDDHFDHSKDQTTNPNSSEVESVPSVWPGSFGAFKYSREAIRFNLKAAVLLLVLVGVVSFVPSFVTGGKDSSSSISLLVSLVFQLLTLFISIAMLRVYLASVRRQKIDAQEALTSVEPMLVLKYIGYSIVSSVVLVLSFLLFIVPFFFVLPRLMLAPYFLIDKNMGPIEALQASWTSSKGHSGKIWGVIGASIVMALPIVTIIGIPVSIYLLVMYSAVYALLYLYITGHQTSVAAPVAPAPIDAI